MTKNMLAHGCATLIDEQFTDLQDRFRQIALNAANRFLHRGWAALQADTANRLNLYPLAVNQAASRLREILKDHASDMDVWTAAKTDFADRTTPRDDRELA
jgi:isocitrate dehydrogenase kinase/phosphatase